MKDKVEVECPHCGQRFVQNLRGLYPGMYRHCPGCDGCIRFSETDLEHLYAALKKGR